MASTITAGNATNGLALSCDNTGILELKTGTGSGTTGLTIDASQNTSLAGTVTAPSLIPSGSTTPTNGMFLPAASTVGFSTASTERARIDSSGNLLVGTTSSSQTVGEGLKVTDAGRLTQAVASFSTSGNSNWVMYSTGASAYRFYVGWNGTVFATTTTISAISDQRLKENIQDLDVGLDDVMALRPRKFDWKEGKGKNIKGDRGWIAQEFEQVFPDMIDEWKDKAPEGEEPYKSVRADLIPVLVKAIQELKAELDATKAKVAALEAK